jgi:type IV pilus assembly protein PilO
MSSYIRKTVFFVLLIALVIVSYRYMIKPANKHLADCRLRVQDKQDKLNEFQKACSEANDLNDQLEQLEEAIAFFESRLPPTSEIDKVLQDITVIGETQGVERKSIQRLKQRNKNGYIEQPLKMSLVGNFNSFYSFLLEIEKLPRIMKIRELQIKKQSGQEGQIEADFTMSIFFQDKLS